MHVKEFWALGTKITICLEKKDQSLFSSCVLGFKRFEDRYSRFKKESWLGIMNSKMDRWVDATEEDIGIFQRALYYHQATEGYFDIRVKTALDKAGYDQDYSFKKRRQPDDELKTNNDIQEDVLIDRMSSEIMLRKPVDLGGFVKGYAVDKVAETIEQAGVWHYCINAGGDIYAKKGEGAQPWTVLLEDPDNTDKAIGEMEIDGMSIASSAPNRRRWGDSHHLIDPSTGMPQNGCKATYILAKNASDADAFATGAFCAGYERGKRVIGANGIEGLIISDLGKMHKSKRFLAKLFAMKKSEG